MPVHGILSADNGAYILTHFRKNYINVYRTIIADRGSGSDTVRQKQEKDLWR